VASIDKESTSLETVHADCRAAPSARAARDLARRDGGLAAQHRDRFADGHAELRARA
jgi:hypothetical protein